MKVLLMRLICSTSILLTSELPKFVEGFANLAHDASIWLLVLDPTVAIIVLSWNGIKGMISEDEQEDKVVKKRTAKIIFWAVFIFCVSGLVTLISSYFV